MPALNLYKLVQHGQTSLSMPPYTRAFEIGRKQLKP